MNPAWQQFGAPWRKLPTIIGDYYKVALISAAICFLYVVAINYFNNGYFVTSIFVFISFLIIYVSIKATFDPIYNYLVIDYYRYYRRNSRRNGVTDHNILLKRARRSAFRSYAILLYFRLYRITIKIVRRTYRTVDD